MMDGLSTILHVHMHVVFSSELHTSGTGIVPLFPVSFHYFLYCFVTSCKVPLLHVQYGSKKTKR